MDGDILVGVSIAGLVLLVVHGPGGSGAETLQNRDLKRKASDCTGSWVMARDEAM